MTDIDWAKAPEGFPVWIQNISRGAPGGSGWHRDGGDRWTDMDGRYWLKGSEQIKVHLQPAWSGTGLPPVGTVCEYLFSEGDEWRKGTVVAHHEGRAVVCDIDDDAAERVQERNLRPIRTPEQIAAEERERAIREMASTPKPCGFAIADICEQLYDAGYRKQDQPK